MDFHETPMTEETVYRGIIVRVRRDKVKLADNTQSTREVVEHPGGVAVFAIDEQERVVMVRQFRYPVNAEVLELPAGKLEPGEEPLASALRELEEETGIIPTEIQPMGFSYSSPGIFTEKIYHFFARGLQQRAACPDEGELLEAKRVPLETLLDMIRENRLADGKSIVGIMKGALRLQEDGNR